MRRRRPWTVALIATPLAVALVAAGALSSPAGPQPLPEATTGERVAQSADDFVESIGVNVHLSYVDTPYEDITAVIAALDDAGIRHVRDGFEPGLADTDERMRRVTAAGISFTMITGRPDRDDGVGADQLLQQLTSAVPTGVVGVEGPNEYDISGDPEWATALRSYQQELYDAVQAKDSLDGVPVIAPSLVERDSRRELGIVAADVGNLHSYTGGEQPTGDALEDELELAAAVTGNRPVLVTETGYHTAVTSTDGQPGVSEAAAGIYVPRQYLENFRTGIQRTFTYELLDQFPDPTGDSSESNYGLLRHDLSPKPSFESVEELISVLSDPGPAFPLRSLPYEIVTGDADVRQLLLQQRDGTFFLALWLEEPVFDLQRKLDLRSQARGIQLDVGDGHRVAAVHLPSSTPVSRAVTAGSTLSLDVSGEAVLVEVRPVR